MSYVIGGLIAAFVVLVAYVRLSPIKAKAWHKSSFPLPVGDYAKADRFMAVRAISDPSESLDALDRVIRTTARTARLAGSVDERMITYVTRSRVFGFPDITTVQAGPDDTGQGFGALKLRIEGRLRFGKSDLGVNRTRIEGWLAELDLDTPDT